MEIIPRSIPKKKNDFDALINKKEQLKVEISETRRDIKKSSETAFTLESLSAWGIRKITQRVSLIDSAVWGFKIASRLRKIFSKK